ncbi:hypothetical protein DL771_008881 [Monosporascus sp. 5C6A]|nr:hypothetical protein DL771_008881 [Monosporascus sp. 5C6A]
MNDSPRHQQPYSAATPTKERVAQATGNAAGLADRKANISSFGVRSWRRPRLADRARAQRRAGAAAPLAAVDGRLDDGQPHADGACLFWTLVRALGMLVLGLWSPETKDVPMERMEELFGGPWWENWRVRVDLAAAAPPPGPLSSTKDSMENARHSEPVERV